MFRVGWRTRGYARSLFLTSTPWQFLDYRLIITILLTGCWSLKRP